MPSSIVSSSGSAAAPTKDTDSSVKQAHNFPPSTIFTKVVPSKGYTLCEYIDPAISAAVCRRLVYDTSFFDDAVDKHCKKASESGKSRGVSFYNPETYARNLRMLLLKGAFFPPSVDVPYHSVTYSPIKCKIGRIYASKGKNRLSAQCLSRPIRHTIFKDEYVDIDIANAHPVLLLSFCVANNLEVGEAFKRVATDRDALFVELMKEGVSRSVIKQSILKLQYGGGISPSGVAKSPLYDTFMKQLKLEMGKIRSSVIRTAVGIQLAKQIPAGSVSSSWNREGRIVSYLCQMMENTILDIMIAEANDRGLEIGANCFDGFLIRRNAAWSSESGGVAFLRAAERRVMAETGGTKIVLIEKQMDEAIDEEKIDRVRGAVDARKYHNNAADFIDSIIDDLEKVRSTLGSSAPSTLPTEATIMSWKEVAVKLGVLESAQMAGVDEGKAFGGDEDCYNDIDASWDEDADPEISPLEQQYKEFEETWSFVRSSHMFFRQHMCLKVMTCPDSGEVFGRTYRDIESLPLDKMKIRMSSTSDGVIAGKRFQLGKWLEEGMDKSNEFAHIVVHPALPHGRVSIEIRGGGGDVRGDGTKKDEDVPTTPTTASETTAVDPQKQHQQLPTAYNLFEPFKFTREECEGIDDASIANNVQPFLQLMREIVGGDGNPDVNVADLTNRFAWLMQRPGIKSGVVVILHGPFGCGKDLLVDTFGDLIGNSYFVSKAPGEDFLNTPYNACIASSLLVKGEELSFADTKSCVDKFKSLVTCNRLTIQEKYKPLETVDSFQNYMFTTNRSVPIALDSGERRTVIFSAVGEDGRRPPQRSFAEWASMRKHFKDEHFLKCLAAYFYKHPIPKGWSPKDSRPDTQIYRDVVASCRPAMADFFNDFVNGALDKHFYTSESDMSRDDFDYSVNVKIVRGKEPGSVEIRASDFYNFFRKVARKAAGGGYTSTRFGREIREWVTDGAIDKRKSSGLSYILNPPSITTYLESKGWATEF